MYCVVEVSLLEGLLGGGVGLGLGEEASLGDPNDKKAGQAIV